MSRVMLCHCQESEELTLLENDVSFVSCDDSEEMLAEVTLQPPDVVVYEVRPESDSDLAVLRLLRKVAPRIPLVVIGEGSSPVGDVQADLEPLYHSPALAEKSGLREALHSALASRTLN
jgi:DNA-binding NtrC family response regulator